MIILLVYPPFCTPASPGYSIANLYSHTKNFITNNNLDIKLDAIDLNISFHIRNYPEFKKNFQSMNNFNFEDYDKTSKEFRKISGFDYSEMSKKIIANVKLDNFLDIEEIKKSLEEILKFNPDMVAFSIVYSSQSLFTYALARELIKKEIKVVTGGPAVSEKLKESSEFFNDFNSFTDFILKINNISPKISENIVSIPDYSIFDRDLYFTNELMIPIKTSVSCYYKKCAFCTHHQNDIYREYNADIIKKTIENAINLGYKRFMIIDDAIPKKRLLELARIFQSFEKEDISWMCQLRIQNDFDEELFLVLKQSGLKIIIWGIESGSDRILKLMRKGTTVELNEKILKKSRDAGIINGVYIMFGFPTETKSEFLETIDFLERNSDNIDLLSTAIFGLQKGSKVFAKPEDYGIINIFNERRTLLDDSVTFETNSGLSQNDANLMRKKFKKSLEKINKYPKEMNFFREHMLSLCNKEGIRKNA